MSIILTTPIPIGITPFDATSVFTFGFNVIGGKQVVKNQLEIQKTSDSSIVYDDILITFQFQHPISENTLDNGEEYRFRFKTFAVDDSESSWSDWVVFLCLSTPEIEITNIIDGKIFNQTELFTGEYSQTEGELLQSYRFILYNSNQIMIQSFSEVFGLPIQQQITGLQDDTLYYIKLIIKTVNHIEIETSLIPFTPQYQQPRLSLALNLYNLSDIASIKITANVIQIIGQIEEEDPYYPIIYFQDDAENWWIDLSSGRISFQEAFSIDKNFTTKIWVKGIEHEEVFLVLFGEQGYIILFYENRRIKAIKRLHGQPIPYGYYSSNEIPFDINDETTLFIWFQQINDRIELRIEAVMYDVTFNIKDQYDEDVSEALVTLNSLSDYSDYGVAIFTAPIKLYNWQVEKENYITENGQILVDNENKIVNVLLYEMTHIISANASWNSDNLEIILQYNTSLMDDISEVEITQFEFESSIININPDSIIKSDLNEITLTFNDYDFENGDKILSYLEDDYSLLDANDIKVLSPDSILVNVPSKG